MNWRRITVTSNGINSKIDLSSMVEFIDRFGTSSSGNGIWSPFSVVDFGTIVLTEASFVGTRLDAGENSQISGLVKLSPNARLHGKGRVGSVDSSGLVAPDGILNVLDDLQLQSQGQLHIDVTGPVVGIQYDRLAVAGDAVLDGQLNVAFNAPSLSMGQSFDILTVGGTLSGSFTGRPNHSLVNTINGIDVFIYYHAGGVRLYAGTPMNASVSESYVFHRGSSFESAGIDAALDSTKSLAHEGSQPQTLGFDNLINSSRGINGLVFDIDGLPTTALTADDFLFQVSPPGAFDQATNHPSDWQSAPEPSSITVLPVYPSRVVIEWPDNEIADRWLRVTVLANANTGLAQPEVYYIGHLLGETTGSDGDIFTVSLADIAVIRDQVGNAVDAGNIADIDKSGTVTFADFSATRSNVGTQLPAITIGTSSTAAQFGSGRFDDNGKTVRMMEVGKRQIEASLFHAVPSQNLYPQDSIAEGPSSENLRHDNLDVQFERQGDTRYTSSTDHLVAALADWWPSRLTSKDSSDSMVDSKELLNNRRAEFTDLAIKWLTL